LEERVKGKEDVVKAQEAAIRGLREAEAKFRKEIESLKSQIAEYTSS
jgi:phage shock protein A